CPTRCLALGVPSSQVFPAVVPASEHVPSPLQLPDARPFSGAAQVKAVPPQVPAVQTSFLVHGVASSQVVPSVLLASEKVPSTLQVPAWWTTSCNTHGQDVPPLLSRVQLSLYLHDIHTSGEL